MIIVILALVFPVFGSLLEAMANDGNDGKPVGTKLEWTKVSTGDYDIRYVLREVNIYNLSGWVKALIGGTVIGAICFSIVGLFDQSMIMIEQAFSAVDAFLSGSELMNTYANDASRPYGGLFSFLPESVDWIVKLLAIIDIVFLLALSGILYGLAGVVTLVSYPIYLLLV